MHGSAECTQRCTYPVLSLEATLALRLCGWLAENGLRVC